MQMTDSQPTGRRLLTALCGSLVLSSSAYSADWLVDASGAQSSLTTIEQAMLLASPGDRVLVLPGSYPSFHFSRGVEVVGLGDDPSDVTVERVGFHVNIPTVDYDAGLTNLTVCGTGAANSISISGNELARGTLVIEGVRTCGGVFLHGSGDLYVLVANSDIQPGVGGGFLGASFDFAGGMLDLVETRVTAWSADPRQGVGAGTALRLGGGAAAHVSGSEIFAGAGSTARGVEDGGDGIDTGFGASPTRLRLSGGTVVLGGDGAVGGSGGVGVDVPITTWMGDAHVEGGGGPFPGDDFVSGAQDLGFDPSLALIPGASFAEGDTFLRPGDRVQLAADASLDGAILAYGPGIEPPASPDATPIVAAGRTVVDADTLGMMVPYSASSGSPEVRRRVVFQALFRDPDSGGWLTSNPVVVTTVR